MCTKTLPKLDARLLVCLVFKTTTTGFGEVSLLIYHGDHARMGIRIVR